MLRILQRNAFFSLVKQLVQKTTNEMVEMGTWTEKSGMVFDAKFNDTKIPRYREKTQEELKG